MLSAAFWSGLGGNAQHTAVSPVAGQPMQGIVWQSKVDQNPQYDSSGELLIHYGEPAVSQANTLIIPVKTGATGGYELEARDGYTGALRWTVSTDYVLPSHNWTPSYSPVMTSTGRVYFAGAGGTIYYFDNPDSPVAPVVHQLAFYGLANYQANAAAFNNSVFVDTPITADANGDIFFGFRVQGTAPVPLNTTQSGYARIDASGNGSYALVGAMTGDANITRDSHDAAPALSNDGSTLYVVAKATSSSYYGYLVALNATTLATKSEVFLRDPRNGNGAGILDDGTSSPLVAPDGTVFLGVFGNPYNGSRGFTLHFDATLATQYTPAAFGWDDTGSIVPASMVPGYTGTSSYLLFVKYNNYAGNNGSPDFFADGVNKIAILDPNATQLDNRNDGAPTMQVMKEVMTATGPTPDTDFINQGFPNAVHEWCINSCVVDPATDSIYANSEDGKFYRWDLKSGALTQPVTLTAGLGEAYTPTWMGPDGKVYAINNATLFAVGATGWDGYAGNPQHTALSQTAAQPFNAVHWSVNIDPNASGNAIHYGTPLITPGNTVIIPIRTGSNPGQTPTTDTFGLQFVNGADGSNKWTPTAPATTDLVTTDYVLPPYNWTPSFAPVLTPSVLWPGETTAVPRVYFAGDGGTLYYIDNPDATTAPTVHQVAFYGLSNYQANPAAYNSSVFIDTPITVDAQGDIFFGFQVTGSNPSGLQSGIARIDRNGTGTRVSASAAAGGDVNVNLVQHNSAPVLSNDEKTLYVGLTNSGAVGYSWLAALDSTTLALKQTSGAQPEKVRLMDPRNNNANPALIIEESSATPMVAPDGTVFFGVFGNPYNGSRGFMLHFSADLQTEYTAGAFGWDDTASVVPASMVPSYTGTSSYLIFVKYNNYVSTEVGPSGADGVNEIAVLDPYASQPDTRNDGDPNLRVMKEVLTIPGPTPDAANTGSLPNAVREWCINTAAVDPFTKSVIANSEDGVLYRWDLTTDTLSQAIRLTGGVGEAYTPTAIGPDGTVYAINDHVLFAVGGLSGGLSVAESSSATPSSTSGQSVTFTAAVTSTGTAPTGSVTFSDGSTVLGTVPLDGSGHAAFTTSALSAGRHMIQAAYSGDTNYAPGSIALIQAVLQTTAPSVASSAAPSLYGQPVTFTATVSPGGPTANVPEGTVTFLDGSTVLGTATLNAGAQATFTTSALSVGFHSITVQYGGDTNFTPGTSPAFNQAVQSATTTAVSSSANPSVFGQSVTFTAAVTATSPGAGTPTGTVTFFDGSTTLGTGTVDGTGHATFATSALAVAGHTITASYGGDALDAGSTSAALTQTVNQDASTTAVTSSANPSVFGQSVTFTATVSASAPGAGTPTGTVTFLDGTTTLGTATLSGGSATFSTAALAVAGHSITVSYGGDGNFTGSTSAALTQTVNQDGTATAVSSSANPAVYGQSVTFTATVSAGAPGAGTPTGTVTFLDGATTLGTATLSGGSATFSTAALAVAGHSITVSYGGDTNFTGSTSAALTQTVNKDGTTAAVSSSVNPSVFGQSVTFTATVGANAPGSGTPTGTVTFLDGATTLGTATLSGGSATFSTAALAVAGHAITVSYGGDGNFTGSTSAALTQTVNKDATGTALASSVNPSVYGQSVTFTATVTATAPGSGTPAGTVAFIDGSTQLGTGTLTGGVATFSTAALSVAGHSITAVYDGSDPGFSGSTSAALTQTVNKDSATAAVSSSANPSVFGQSVTFTATVSAGSPGSGTPTGTVTFLDGAATLGTATLSGGSATFSTAALAVAGHSITVSYGGDTNFTGSTSAALTQTVNKDGTTAAVSSSVNPSVYGQSVTFTATVSANTPGAGTPTGTVTFLDGAATLGTATLSGGSAAFSTSALAVAGHAITVSYGGDGNFTGSTSAALTQTVNKDATGTAVSSSTNPSVYGQSVTFTATVSANTPGAGTATGTVTFKDGASTLGTATLSGGSASFSTAALAVAGHSITVSYGGDGNFTGSTSAALTQTVNQAGTTASVASSANPSVFGQGVTFTATVSASAPGAGTPTGTVTFLDGSTTLGTATLSGGSAAFSTSALAVAGHSITVSYGGDGNFTGSTSAALTQTVNKDASTTTVTSSANPSVAGQSVTFTATVTANAPGSGTPTGTVTFYDGSTALGTGTLSGGSAAYSTSALTVGGHTITATYNADASFTGSTSAALTQTVNPNVIGTTTALASSADPSVHGQSVTFTATVQPASGSGTPTGTVTFYDGSNSLGSAALSGGKATLATAALSVGSHPITAKYGGDPSYLASTSGVLTQTVNKAATAVSVTSSENPSTRGQAVTYTATVTAQSPGSGTATGTVNFYDGSKLLGTATLNSMGVASAVYNLVTLGTHPITAVYAGDTNFTGSTSPVYGQTVIKFWGPGPGATRAGLSAGAAPRSVGTTDLALALFGPAPSLGKSGGAATSAGAASTSVGGVTRARADVLGSAPTLAHLAELKLGGTPAQGPAVAELDRLFAAFGKGESAGGNAGPGDGEG